MQAKEVYIFIYIYIYIFVYIRSRSSRALQGTCRGACDISGCCGQHLRLCCGYIRAPSRYVWVLSFGGGGGRFGYDGLSLSLAGLRVRRLQPLTFILSQQLGILIKQRK